MKKSLLIIGAGLLLAASQSPRIQAAEPSQFSSKQIDLGVVVSDLDRSLKFYKEAIGFQELPGFTVDGQYSKKFGLTDGKALDIRVLALGVEEGAAKLKLMQIKGGKAAKPDNTHIDSQLGFSYITLFVTDMTVALARLDKAGVKPITEGKAVELPPGFPEGIFLTVVKDPDGNFVELVGPKK